MADRVTIIVDGLEVFGRHGVFPAERELGQRFLVDLELELLACSGAETDDLAGTVDYARLAADVAAIVAGPPQALLEHLAALIADRALAEPLAQRAAVSIRKPHVAIPERVAATGVRLERARAHTYWIGLGANLGDRLAGLQGLVDGLRDGGAAVEALSPVYETAPREIEDQPAFLNAAVRVRTELPPRALLDAAKAVERRLGRSGGGIRYGPRPADCDLLVWDGGVWDDERLQLPHPRLHERRFALLPVLDLDPDLTLPDGTRLQAACRAIDPDDQPAARWQGGALG